MDFTLNINIMKKSFLLLLSLIAICCPAQNINKEQLQKERQNLKNYAFCQCLANVYKDQQDSLFKIDGSISSYFDAGAYGLSVYDTIDSVAKIFSKKIYRSKDNLYTLGIMKCLDFYNSAILDSLVKSFDYKINIKILKQ
jgi:hypothetical protein